MLGITVSPYGVGAALGALLAVIATVVCGKRCGLRRAQTETYAILAIPLCLLCARLGYCLMRFYFVRDDMGFLWFFRFTDGGYVFYGALLGGAVAAPLAAKIAGGKPLAYLDAAAPGFMLLIALCRFSEGLIGLGKGWEIENEALCFFPLGVWDDYQEWWFWSLFLLEGLCALTLFCFLLRKPKSRDLPGDRALCMLLVYAAMQLTLESMRTDGVLKWGMVRCSQLISALCVGFVLSCYCARLKGHTGLKISCWLGVLACFGVVMAMEFAIEDKIAFITRFFRAAHVTETKYKLLCCYGAMAVCSGIIPLIASRLRVARER